VQGAQWWRHAHALYRWTESIAQKVKRKKKVEDTGSRKEVLHSVFEPQIHASSLGYGPVSIYVCALLRNLSSPSC
jgi:hypothetical protein